MQEIPNIQAPNDKQFSNSNLQYDLEDRTFKFARDVRILTKKILKHLSTVEDIKQLIRSSGSVGANYIEANEALSKKDFKHRIKICLKETKESRYWLRMLDTDIDQTATTHERLRLIDETTQLLKIFSAILR